MASSTAESASTHEQGNALQPPTEAELQEAGAADLPRQVTAEPPSIHMVRGMLKNIADSGVLDVQAPGGGPVPMMVDASSDRRWLYADFAPRLQGAVEELRRAGVRPGEVLATLVSCGITQQLTVYASTVVGSIAGPIPTPATADEVATGLRALQPDAVLVEAHLLPLLQAAVACAVRRGFLQATQVPRAIVADHPVSPHVQQRLQTAESTSIAIGLDDSDRAEHEGLDRLEVPVAAHVDILEARSAAPLEIPPELESPEALRKPCLLLLSSGSTGLPKV